MKSQIEPFKVLYRTFSSKSCWGENEFN